MDDTSYSIKERMTVMALARTPAERLRMTSSMFDTGKMLIKAGLENDKGHLNRAQLRAQMFLKLYGDLFTQSQIRRIMSAIPNMQLDID